MQAKFEGCDLVVAAACAQRKRVAKPRDRVSVAAPVATDQVLGLLLQVVEIQSIGRSVHRKTSVLEIADGPQYRLHKGSQCSSEAASGFNPSRGPGCGLHRFPIIWRTAPPINPVQNGHGCLLNAVAEPRESRALLTPDMERFSLTRWSISPVIPRIDACCLTVRHRPDGSIP